MRRGFVRQLILWVWTLGLHGAAGPLPGPGFLQAVDLKHLPGGGYSALHMAPDGLHAVTMSDKGFFLRLAITRDKGRIVKVTSGRTQPLLDADGKPLRPGQNDTEGLAVAPDGRAWVSTEGTARVMAYPQLGAAAVRMPRPKEFAIYPPNTAFESIARAPDGGLWLIPEYPVGPGDFPVYLWSGTAWERRYTLPRDGDWRISDAAFDDKGRLYILERFFAGPAGFASRIRRFDIADGPVNDTILLTTPLGLHDNLEGLSLWRQDAALIASMISDDNFLKVFREELVEYRLPD